MGGINPTLYPADMSPNFNPLSADKWPPKRYLVTFSDIDSDGSSVFKYSLGKKMYQHLITPQNNQLIIDARKAKHLWTHSTGTTLTIDITEVGDTANPFLSLAFDSKNWTPFLDDYELGTLEGLYTLIGDMVFISMSATVPANSDSSEVSISGLPFPIYTAPAVNIFTGSVWNNKHVPLEAVLVDTTDKIFLYKEGSRIDYEELSDSQFRLSAFYRRA